MSARASFPPGAPGAPSEPLSAEHLGSPPERPIHERHRAAIVSLIPRWYRPAFHLFTPTVIVLAVLIFALSGIHALRPVELLTVPLTLLLGFAFEWRVHKSVLHRRTPGVGILYDRHELQHHIVFTYDDMAMRSPRELWLVLMPAYAVVLVALVNAPLTYLFSTLLSPNVGFLYLATAMGFFLSYEWLHFAYHLPPTTFLGRRPLIAALREQHRRHHDPRLMKRWNFNVTVPVFDWIYRTNWSPERERAVAEKRTRKQAPDLARPTT
jgi:Fatty acid hydroxylase superfamily